MPHAVDVAVYILKTCGETTALKLQYLMYYAQAWSLVWDDEPLFPEPIQAWAWGPVIPDLYQIHEGQFKVQASVFKMHGKTRLNAAQKKTIVAVIDFYGPMKSHYLTQLTRLERPWKEARADVPTGEACSNVISTSAMAEYYGSL